MYYTITAFNKNLGESNPYYDYALKWINFATKYNLTLLDASSKAFETFLGARKGTAQSIEKTIRSSFNTTLRDNLNDDTLASSMADYIDSSIKMCNLFGYNQITSNFYDFSYASRMLEQFRDKINRTPSEVIEMKGKFNLLHYKLDLAPKHKNSSSYSIFAYQQTLHFGSVT
jgi:hypothetical protein